LRYYFIDLRAGEFRGCGGGAAAAGGGHLCIRVNRGTNHGTGFLSLFIDCDEIGSDRARVNFRKMHNYGVSENRVITKRLINSDVVYRL